MSKLVSCFECGYDYKAKDHEDCPRCGEVKIFVLVHKANYDLMRDPVFLAKYRLRYAVILFLIFALTFSVILR